MLEITLRKKRVSLLGYGLYTTVHVCMLCWYIWSIALDRAETSTIRKVDQRCLGTFEKWCWRRMEKISWTDRVRNEEVLQRVKDRNIVHTLKKRKAKWIGNILRRNCLLRHGIEGTVAGSKEKGGRGRRRKQPLNDQRNIVHTVKKKEG